MQILINDTLYNVEIIHKNIKNMYLRVKDDLVIYITCPKKISDKLIMKFINDNIKSITKMINTIESKNARLNNKLLYLLYN